MQHEFFPDELPMVLYILSLTEHPLCMRGEQYTAGRKPVARGASKVVNEPE